NALGGREHRLAESRGQSAAPLPDKALVVFEPALEVITWMIPPIPKSAPCSRVLMARSRRGICGSPIVS
ncbi:hypothetical protein, partial [Thiocystis violacea]|uniref:hypothetical protein n=1 Tax=Thiocystis violacea TaxID=13725 RepID=UPI003F85F248